MLAFMNDELKSAMKQTGCASIKDVYSKGKALFYSEDEIYTAKL